LVLAISDFEIVSKPIAQDIVKFAYRHFQTAFPDCADKILQLWNKTADLDASEQMIAERAQAFNAHKRNLENLVCRLMVLSSVIGSYKLICLLGRAGL